MERSIEQGKVKRLIAKGAVVVIAAAAALPALAFVAAAPAEGKPGNSEYGNGNSDAAHEAAANNPGSDNRSQTAP